MDSQIEFSLWLHTACLLFKIPLTRYLLSTYSVPQTLPSPRDIVWKTISLCCPRDRVEAER